MFPLKGHKGRERLQVGAEQIWGGKGESQAPGEGGGLPRAGAVGSSLIGCRPGCCCCCCWRKGDWTIHRNYFSKACTVSPSIISPGERAAPGNPDTGGGLRRQWGRLSLETLGPSRPELPPHPELRVVWPSASYLCCLSSGHPHCPIKSLP